MNPVLRPELRGYQRELIERARAARRAGHRRILITSATGSGKTVMAAEMVRTAVGNGQRVLIIGHRQELVSQFWVKLQDVGITAGIMRCDDERTDPKAPVQVGTIQTLGRRELPPAELVVVDEAHRAPGDSYTKLLLAYPKSTVLGLTATPCRLDGRPIQEQFDTLVEGAPYSALIDLGAIVAPIVYAPRRVPDLRKVRSVAGDYHEGDLEEVMFGVVGDVVEEWQKHGAGRSTVVFAVGVDHSRELVARFREAGVRAAHLDGTTPDYERNRLLCQLESGDITGTIQLFGVLCEGWDCPPVKCCVMARPTKSLTLWMQTSGRILRPWGDLPPVILDHAGNVDRHGLPHEDRTWSLDGVAKRASETRYRTCPSCYAYVTGSPCPLCGHVAAVKPRTIKQADGVLERVDMAIAKERSSDPKRAFFDAQVDKARRQGFKPGYASAKYKEKFDGAWPPWDWSQQTKQEFSRDPEWIAKCEKRERERKFWQERQTKPEFAEVTEPDDPMYFDVSDL